MYKKNIKNTSSLKERQTYQSDLKLKQNNEDMKKND